MDKVSWCTPIYFFQAPAVPDMLLLGAEDSLNMGIRKDESPLWCFLMGRLLSYWWSWLLQDHPQGGIHHSIPSEFVAPGFKEIASLCCESQLAFPFCLIRMAAIKLVWNELDSTGGSYVLLPCSTFLDSQQVSWWMSRKGVIKLLPPYFMWLEYHFDLWWSYFVRLSFFFR